MKYLSQGLESNERFKLLLKLTSMRSKSMEKALRAHLVQGMSEATSCAFHNVTQSNFNRDLAKLEAVAAVVEQIKEIDWARFKSEK